MDLTEFSAMANQSSCYCACIERTFLTLSSWFVRRSYPKTIQNFVDLETFKPIYDVCVSEYLIRRRLSRGKRCFRFQRGPGQGDGYS